MFDSQFTTCEGSLVMLTEQDIAVFRAVIKEEIAPLRSDINEFREEFAASFEILFKRDEKRDQEFLSLKMQFQRIEDKLLH